MATATKERPILFSGEMVRAILAGRKTMTRRVVKHPEQFMKIRDSGFCCPCGQPGDRLWVRETLKAAIGMSGPKICECDNFQSNRSPPATKPAAKELGAAGHG